MTDSEITHDLISHLLIGWTGLTKILTKATKVGVKLDGGEIDRLEKMAMEVLEVIRRQREG